MLRKCASSAGLALVALLGLAGGQVALGQEPQSLETENAELKARVAALESRLGTLADTVDGLRSENEEVKDRLAEAEAGVEAQLDLDIEEAISSLSAVASAPANVTSKYPVTFYGYLKFDMAYDSGRINDGNFARWVDMTDGDDDQFNATARQTRLGFKWTGPSGNGMSSRAQFEIDFYNGGAQNKNLLQMRHAYVAVKWDEADIEVLGGQTWDVISPLNAPTVNYSGLWWMGDPGFRRAQLRVTKGFDAGDDGRITAIVALARTIGSDIFGTSPGDSGEDSGWPTIQGRLTMNTSIFSDKQDAEFGVYGHYGQEEFDQTGPGADEIERDTYSVGFYFKLMVTDTVTVMGDVWYGTNMGSFLGGTGQGINGMTLEEIDAWGGWVAITVKAAEDVTLAAGIGIDDPDEDDLNTGMRDRNFVVFANAKFALDEATTAGLEIMYLETEYAGAADSDAIRIQGTLIFSF